MSPEPFAYNTPRRRRPFLRGCLITFLVVVGLLVLFAAMTTIDWISFTWGENSRSTG